MLEIVNDIVQVEHECEALVAAAREEAQRAQTAFDAEERRRLQEAKAAADVRVADRVGAVRERVAKETEERVNRARASADRYLQDNAAAIDAVVRDAEAIVLRTLTDENSSVS